MTSRGLGFGLLGPEKAALSADYKSADSGQSELMLYVATAVAAAYTLLYTVPTGKTLYISMVHMLDMRAAPGSRFYLATGNAGAEVVFLVGISAVTTPFILPLSTPLKFEAGTKISVYTEYNDTAYFNLNGWLQ